MTIAPEHRTLLTVHTHARGKRSPVTCRLKCNDACLHPAPNESANEYFKDVVSSVLSRRAMLGTLAVAAGAVVIGAQGMDAPSAAAAPLPEGRFPGHGGSGLAFGAIDPQPVDVDALVVPEGYTWDPIIRWGDPILPGARTFDPNNQSPEQQAKQFGYNCDYLDILPFDVGDEHRGTRGLLVSNLEYTNAAVMFPPSAKYWETDAAGNVTDKKNAYARAIERAAHGMAVVEVRRRAPGKPWSYQRISPVNRRIHLDTEFVIDGPAAGTDLMKTAADPTGTRVLGTMNNCAGGTTPWGTVLSGEENFNGYFVAAGANPTADARYGIGSSTSYGWEADEPRFAQSEGYENEANRFGWIVELDPHDPSAPPVKHTAMGRFKHEGANVTLSRRGHAVAYMGDDQAFDYVYKFVSKDRVAKGDSRWARRHNKTLLSDGDLYVAKFTGDSPAAEIDGSGAVPSDGAFDGTGEWLPLVVGGVSKVPGMSVEEVLIYTRLAGDKVGATKMDRPEDVEISPVTGRIYVACTNNSGRTPTNTVEGPTEANPRNRKVVNGATTNGNRDGHVVEIIPSGDQTSTRFTWNLLLVAGDPAVEGTYFSGYPKERVSPISCPDNLAFDAEGNLWISTDGQPSSSAIAKCDGLFKVPVTGRERGHVQQFLSVPAGAETCGPLIDSRDGMVYVNVQHPGEDGTYAAPQSYFPDYVAEGAPVEAGDFRGPRPTVVQVYRKR
ncbi:PhoX family protein [Promicromonospora panici]|uniref:PhoX family protein n=1 Tax=Promicromonospora panici TaxID=2219658 RepID=UPI00101D626F|nr:PhoX family phosphatase [Promicromonospora panici]